MLLTTPRGDNERNYDLKKNPGRLFLDLFFYVEPVFAPSRIQMAHYLAGEPGSEVFTVIV